MTPHVRNFVVAELCAELWPWWTKHPVWDRTNRIWHYNHYKTESGTTATFQAKHGVVWASKNSPPSTTDIMQNQALWQVGQCACAIVSHTVVRARPTKGPGRRKMQPTWSSRQRLSSRQDGMSGMQSSTLKAVSVGFVGCKDPPRLKRHSVVGTGWWSLTDVSALGPSSSHMFALQGT